MPHDNMFSHLIFSHKVAYEGISALCRSSASSVNQPLWRSDQCKTSVALRHIKKAMTKSVFTTHSRSLCIFRVCWWKVSGFKKTIFGRFCWWPVLVKAGKRIVSVKHLFLTTTVMNPFSGLHPNWLCWSSSPWNQGFSSEGYRLQITADIPHLLSRLLWSFGTYWFNLYLSHSSF